MREQQEGFFETEEEKELLRKVKSKDGTEFWCRNSADEGVVTGFMNDYAKFIKSFGADETWLDIGAHIGTFSVSASPLVRRVIAFEACPENCQILKMNAENCQNVEVRQQAVIGTEQKTVRFAQGGKGTMRHVAKYGTPNTREVSAVSFNSLLTEDVCVKMDIEGGELPIIDNLTDWSRIKRFMLEFHSNALKDRDHTIAKRVLEQFRQNFKTVETDFKETKAWAYYIYGGK